MEQSYPKQEKLKGKTLIDSLFKEGKSVAQFPLRLVFIEVTAQEVPLRMGVSVSKRYFKRANRRNYIKRLLRECYRLNKGDLLGCDKRYSCMLLYQSNQEPRFDELEPKVKKLFAKALEQWTSAERQ